MSNQIDRVFVNGKWYVSDSARQFAQAQAVREAIAAERARWSAFADEKGEPRKVLGTLPVTADGCIVGEDAAVWRDKSRSLTGDVRSDSLVLAWGAYETGNPCRTRAAGWYSTREAAESARAEAGKGDGNAT